MAGVDDPTGRRQSGRALGWVSGLGLVVVPWVVGGVLATIGSMVGPESWNPENTFPWTVLAGFVAMLAWIGYGSVRIGEFRRGGLLGGAIALVVVATAYALVRVLQP